MIISGKMYAEAPIYRGNSKKTLFTRDFDGKEKLVSLAGEVSGTAQSLMDAFIGESKNGKNIGLINRLWQRLFNERMPALLYNVTCELSDDCYAKNHFFDMRMGLKLDDDRAAPEAGKNYKMETVFRGAIFNFSMEVDRKILMDRNNGAKLYCMLEELKAGRFWYGAGKSKGLGRCRLELSGALPELENFPDISSQVNYLIYDLAFDTKSPLMVGWNWGHVDQVSPEFPSIEGKFLIEGMRNIPLSIRERLAMAIGGPIKSADSWQKEFIKTLPKALALWVMDNSGDAKLSWVLSSADVKKLSKGKFALPKSILSQIQSLVNQPFDSKESMEQQFTTIVGEVDAKKYRRILSAAKQSRLINKGLSEEKWEQLEQDLGIESSVKSKITENFGNRDILQTILADAVLPLLSDFSIQIHQQIKLLQSDPWVEDEINIRKDHIAIKEMLLSGQIDANDWGDMRAVPNGVSASSWQEFLHAHQQVQYNHMLNRQNLLKSITNDQNIISFLMHHRTKARQVLSQVEHIDFRAGGADRRHISRKYGKPYDSIFMRMLQWSPVGKEERWEVYIPGSTVKGAFRKRAVQILGALWGEGRDLDDAIHVLFGAQRQPGILRFSDAYPADHSQSKKAWCAVDGIMINPKTGQPEDKSKSDYLFAYGPKLKFHLKIYIQDMMQNDRNFLYLLNCLIKDFSNGEIPLGGEKTNGMGWINAELNAITWLASDNNDLTNQLFKEEKREKNAFWEQISLQDSKAMNWVKKFSGIKAKTNRTELALPTIKTESGYVSHRIFGGYCGLLRLEGEVITPLHIRESGEPSFTDIVSHKPVQGWDMFSLSSPEKSLRDAKKCYAIPSKTLRGALRHLYTIASQSKKTSRNINQLTPVEKLFGWVGDGPNQALMGRISIEFAKFSSPTLAWFGAPNNYGEWRCEDGSWYNTEDKVQPTLFAGEHRIFPHTSLAPCVEQHNEFAPTSLQKTYFRAIMPKSICQANVRFWNLDEEELSRLLWCIMLENNMAHKMGKLKQLGLGSIRFHLLPDSYLINWSEKYSNTGQEWMKPIDLINWKNPNIIHDHDALRIFLDVTSI